VSTPPPPIVRVVTPLIATESGMVGPVVTSLETIGSLAVGGMTALSPAVGLWPWLQLAGVAQLLVPPPQTLSVEALALAGRQASRAIATSAARPMRARCGLAKPRAVLAVRKVTILSS
jgi:hypothetical protein